MIEEMLTVTMLVLGIALLMLVINYRFRKYSRLLLWTEGIAAIVGTMLGIGLGWIRLFLHDGYPNFPCRGGGYHRNLCWSNIRFVSFVY